MKLLSSDITYYDDSFREEIKDSTLGFLRQLTGLTVFDLKGKDTSRTRVLATLIHGNEPSGFIASHLWLKSRCQPETNLRIIICNPEAALTKPLFTNRFLAHSQDLNRFFAAPESDQSQVANRARAILQAIREVKPEAILDLHNTSGKSPAFGVSLKDTEMHIDLVSLFTRKMIFTGLKVGALMECDFEAPVVTIECGGADENDSHQVATNGLHEFVSRETLFGERHMPVDIHRHPIRIELIGEASVGFANHQLPTTDVTFRIDVEELNHQVTPKGEFLGWFNSSHPLPLKAIDENGEERMAEFIEIKNNCFFARCDLQLFMVTTVREIATNDCLFYMTVESEQ